MRNHVDFTTHNRLYEFAIMPFGLCNVPATFQRLMSKVLKELINQKCIVYLDDILVMDKTFTKCLENLRQEKEANLYLKLRKCYLAKLKVLYLQYVVSDAVISVDKSKEEAV